MRCNRTATRGVTCYSVLPLIRAFYLQQRAPRIFKLALVLSVSSAAINSATIDAGTVLTRPYFVSDGTTAALVDFSSTDGNFALSGLGIPGGGNLFCAQDFGVFCPFGESYSIQAFFPDAGSGLVDASATINGDTVGTVVLGCPGLACPHSMVQLIADPVTISEPGSYVVPFYATGQIQAKLSVGSPFILDQTVVGVGLLSFAVTQSSPGKFEFVNQYLAGNDELMWSFVAVPEPSTILLTLLALVTLALWRRLSKVKA